MPDKESKETDEKISQLQILEQNLQGFLLQKQSLHAQLLEVDSALLELDKTDTAYKIVGNIMVKTKKDILQKDLNEKKEIITLKMKSIERQENKIKETMQSTQKEVLDSMKMK